VGVAGQGQGGAAWWGGCVGVEKPYAGASVLLRLRGGSGGHMCACECPAAAAEQKDDGVAYAGVGWTHAGECVCYFMKGVASVPVRMCYGVHDLQEQCSRAALRPAAAQPSGRNMPESRLTFMAYAAPTACGSCVASGEDTV
jgi:hypothetical protein